MGERLVWDRKGPKKKGGGWWCFKKKGEGSALCLFLRDRVGLVDCCDDITLLWQLTLYAGVVGWCNGQVGEAEKTVYYSKMRAGK